MKWKRRFELVKMTVLEFFKERSFMHGAALAYYAILALIPALYLIVTYFGMIVGNDVIVQIIDSSLKELIGLEDTSGILAFIKEVDFTSGNPILQMVGIIALLFSCSAILNALRVSINDFYDVVPKEEPSKKLILRTMIARLVSMGFVLGVTVLMVVLYFAETIFLSISNQFLEDIEFLNSVAVTIGQHGLPILTNLIVFSFIFKFLHDGVVQWKYAIRGSFITSVLLYGGQLLIQYYLNNFFFASDGGVAGALLVILVWVYYSSQIIFFGAKYIAVRSREAGVPIVFRD